MLTLLNQVKVSEGIWKTSYAVEPSSLVTFELEPYAEYLWIKTTDGWKSGSIALLADVSGILQVNWSSTLLLPSNMTQRIAAKIASGLTVRAPPVSLTANRRLVLCEEEWPDGKIYFNKIHKHAQCPKATVSIQYLFGEIDTNAKGQLKIDLVTVDEEGKHVIRKDPEHLECKQSEARWSLATEPLFIQNGRCDFQYHFGTISHTMRKHKLAVRLQWKEDSGINKFRCHAPRLAATVDMEAPFIRCPEDASVVFTSGMEVKTKSHRRKGTVPPCVEPKARACKRARTTEIVIPYNPQQLSSTSSS